VGAYKNYHLLQDPVRNDQREKSISRLILVAFIPPIICLDFGARTDGILRQELHVLKGDDESIEHPRYVEPHQLDLYCSGCRVPPFKHSDLEREEWQHSIDDRNCHRNYEGGLCAKEAQC